MFVVGTRLLVGPPCKRNVPTASVSRAACSSSDAAAAEARLLTTNHVTWNLPDVAGWTNSPDISDIINELIGLYGPYSSGTMLMLLRGLITTSTSIYTAKSYDSDPALSPKLVIEWASAGGGAQIIGLGL